MCGKVRTLQNIKEKNSLSLSTNERSKRKHTDHVINYLV